MSKNFQICPIDFALHGDNVPYDIFAFKITVYGDIDLGQHRLRLWLVAWRHQAITWTNVDLSSVRSSGIHLRTIS